MAPRLVRRSWRRPDQRLPPPPSRRRRPSSAPLVFPSHRRRVLSVHVFRDLPLPAAISGPAVGRGAQALAARATGPPQPQPPAVQALAGCVRRRPWPATVRRYFCALEAATSSRPLEPVLLVSMFKFRSSICLVHYQCTLCCLISSWNLLVIIKPFISVL